MPRMNTREILLDEEQLINQLKDKSHILLHIEPDGHQIPETYPFGV
jgi:hypothetical protein